MSDQPDEHKFAVYTPLFAPIAVPMIIALLKELVGWWKRRKGKKPRTPRDTDVVAEDDRKITSGKGADETIMAKREEEEGVDAAETELRSRRARIVT